MTAKPQFWKLVVHQQTFSKESVIVHGDNPEFAVGDIIVIFHPDIECCRLLVEVKEIVPNNQQKGTISVISSLAYSFRLRQYKDVVVHKIDRELVRLNMVEVVVKDHFVTRSDAWRLHQMLIGTCVYRLFKVDYMNMRITVNELWRRGVKCVCGVVGETTKIVYRSKSAKFHIFVQMSSEMWEFDPYGDLYFEKGIMGFLQDLFTRWKEKMDCNHEVVIVLFSRTYYDTITSKAEFLKDIQRGIRCTRDGRLYQDFYKIIRQSEKQDNLNNVIIDLKRSFHCYLKNVSCHQPRTSVRSQAQQTEDTAPFLGVNSRAAEGNLLEAINLSLNVFEKTYIDCNLEETNCTTLVITPSTGVFEVDEDLALLSNKRLIENGVAIDLVCLATQPLHSVPLFKLIRSKNCNESDCYSVPHWINLSYYRPPNLENSSVFVPRMQLPPKPLDGTNFLEPTPPYRNQEMSHEEFDASVFDYMKPKRAHVQRFLPRVHATLDVSSVNSSPEVAKSFSNPTLKKLSLQEDLHSYSLLRSVSEDQGKKGSFDEMKFKLGAEKDDNAKISLDKIETSTENGLNPFKPHSVSNVITLFKHRWLHALPMNTKGYTMQVHHQKVVTDDNEPTTKSPAPEVEEAALAAVECKRRNVLTERDSGDEENDDKSCQPSEVSSPNDDVKSLHSLSTQASSQLHEDWTTTIITGVDWKSLCTPACLPLTINFFPDEKNLGDNYFEYHYTMVIEDFQREATSGSDAGRFDRSSIPPEKKFEEMISQRLAQGFQFVTVSSAARVLRLENARLQSMKFDPKNEYVLSMGYTIHRLKLVDTEVHVTLFSLRENSHIKPIVYRYNIWPHNCLQYSLSETTLSYDPAGKYNWNSLDRYICETEKEYSKLTEHMKYWRTRFLLLPVRCAPFAPREVDGMERIEGFLRFLEGMNKIKRAAYNKHLFDSRAMKTKVVTQDESKVPDAAAVATPRNTGTTEVTTDATSATSTDSLAETSLYKVIKVMTNPSSGFSFLPKQDNLCNYTFVSAEAIAWMIKTIDGCNTKSDAVALGQRLLQANLITHASGSPRQNFIDGFFLYFVTEQRVDDDNEKRWFNSRKTEEELLTSYNIQWLEAAVWRDDQDDVAESFLLDELPPPEYIYSKKRKDGSIDQIAEAYVPLYKHMEYNLDAESKSGRSEWCALSYHGNYYPNKCAYAIEMNWMAATGCIIADLVQKWSHKAQSCGVHIVPAPMCVFPGKSIRCSRNPFRKQPFVPLNIKGLLKPDQNNLFEDYDPRSWPRRLFLFQQAILRKFDFLRDIPQTAPESIHGTISSGYQYIHSSGSVLVKINDAAIFGKEHQNPSFSGGEIMESPFRKNKRPSKKSSEAEKDEFQHDSDYNHLHGFFWVYNYALSKKWRTAFTGDVLNAHAYVVTFVDFCANKDDQLLRFWEESCDRFLSNKKDSTNDVSLLVNNDAVG